METKELTIKVNDILDVLRRENQCLGKDLCFERKMTDILENIRKYSLVLLNDCKCDRNLDIKLLLNQFNTDYDVLKLTKDLKRDNAEVVESNANNGRHSAKRKTRANDNSLPSVSKTTDVIIACDECEEVFDTKTGLEIHVKRVHKNDKHFECNRCQQRFDSELDLEIHVNRDHEDMDSYVCHECKQVFTTRDLFSQHLSQSHGSKDTPNKRMIVSPKRYDFDFRRRDENKTPKRVNNSVEKSVSEKTIRNETKVKKNLFKSDITSEGVRQQIINKCLTMKKKLKTGNRSLSEPKAKSYQCMTCLKGFISEANLEIHFNSTHTNFKPYICEVCLDGFYGKQPLDNHLAAVHGMAVFECHLCEFKTKSKSSLSSHKGIHSAAPKSHTCQAPGCGQTFSLNQNLIRHQNRRHSATPLLFVCHSCKYKSTTKEEMSRHLLSHSSDAIDATDRQFECNVCHKVLKTQLTLKSHMNVKHGLKSPKKRIKSSKKTNGSPKGANASPKSANTSLKSANASPKSATSGKKPYRPFVCNWPDCKSRFRTSPRLEWHLRDHKLNENRFKCTRNGCSFGTDTYAKLNEHKRNKHNYS